MAAQEKYNNGRTEQKKEDTEVSSYHKLQSNY